MCESGSQDRIHEQITEESAHPLFQEETFQDIQLCSPEHLPECVCGQLVDVPVPHIMKVEETFEEVMHTQQERISERSGEQHVEVPAQVAKEIREGS